ncbi:fumarylacetoacetate hydrolase family protein [Anaeromyxobacter diazotrophicus]|uniref:2-hydroxyhepta-2,4-diene-1,7-dioate isomerase n=1 Tax=Anaeromyxobacter diazotrophicus TaxID=2590199 RepID=A0A7I9VTP6_9BACT|nr:fumarylacetoacetate hydrolase family protein [Anaeromyxobacter diazotrophicus]GEJ59337.1 2-hydroxyhepta-2,4-diene-1,7-dioate isomerase [Anaeromyxobacter diazotrophicus]
MALWLRCEHAGRTRIGTLEGGAVHLHEGDLFSAPRPTGEAVPLEAVRLLTPTVPSKLIGLVNNFREGAAKAGLPIPAEPLWFLKAPSSYLAPGAAIRLPAQEVGKVIYEGELGVVIGRAARDVPEGEADTFIFGYTCVNDVTALDLIGRDAQYPQWSRAKSFDTFGPFGPVVATGLDPDRLTVRTLVKGKVRQEYPLSDAVFGPRQLVAHLSRQLTLLPGDVIACGTSVGIGVLRPGLTVEVAVDGIGALANPVAGPEGAP